MHVSFYTNFTLHYNKYISTFKPRYNEQVSIYFIIIFRIEKKIILLIGGGGGIGGGMQGSGGGFGGQVQGDDCR